MEQNNLSNHSEVNYSILKDAVEDSNFSIKMKNSKQTEIIDHYIEDNTFFFKVK